MWPFSRKPKEEPISIVDIALRNGAEAMIADCKAKQEDKKGTVAAKHIHQIALRHARAACVAYDMLQAAGLLVEDE